jgi:hypothetical protein
MPDTDTTSVYEELNRLRKAAKLALAFGYWARAIEPSADAQRVAVLSQLALPKVWSKLAKEGFLTRPSEATIALAIDLLAGAARHPSARTS